MFKVIAKLLFDNQALSTLHLIFFKNWLFLFLLRQFGPLIHTNYIC